MSFRSKLKRVVEQFTGRAEGSAWVFSRSGSLWGGMLPAETYSRKDLFQLYRDNPYARQAIDMTTADVLGAGFYVEAKDPRVVEAVNSFAEKVNLDGLLFLCVRDMLVTGDGTAELIYDSEGKVERTVTYDSRSERKEVIAPREGAKLVSAKWVPSWSLDCYVTPLGELAWWGQGNIYFHPDKILNFKYNPLGIDAYGTSELTSVYHQLKNLVEAQDLFIKILKRYSAPPILWLCKGLTKGEIERHKREVEEKSPTEDIYLNTDLIDAKVLEIDPRGRFENYYEQIEKAVLSGLQSPTLPSISKSTRASSRTILDFYEKKINRIRRIVKREVERGLFSRIARQAGSEEIPRLRWFTLGGLMEKSGPEFILELFDRNLLSPAQAKKNLTRLLGIDFGPEEGERVE